MALLNLVYREQLFPRRSYQRAFEALPAGDSNRGGATLARARSMARGSAALDNQGSQAQSGMLEHGDRGAAR
jgi:hypothetical protein